MITIVAQVLDFCAKVLSQIFLLASLTGKLIVAALAGITNLLFGVFENIVLFLQILYEDNIISITEEIPYLFSTTIETVGNQLDSVISVLGTLQNNTIAKLNVTLDASKYIIYSVFTVLSEVLCLLKDAAIYLGSAMWLIITFLPVHLPSLIQMGLKCFKSVIIDLVVDAYMVLLKCTNFMTDVPLESFIGITTAVITVRLCAHYRADIVSGFIELYWLLQRKIRYLYYVLYNYVTDSEVRVIAHMASGQEVTARDTNLSASEIDDGSAAEALCIICQERQKCVLTLPCRHVCLCAECCRRLYGYQRTCPICRTFIYHSVTVYL